MHKAAEDSIYLLIKVIPKASKTEVVGWEGDRLKIRLAAIPDKGLANTELIKFLSKIFSIAKSQITIVQGETSRLKKVLLQGLSAKQMSERLKIDSF